MTPEARKLYAVIVEVRVAFNRLKSISDAMNRDLGIAASMRAVMEIIAEQGPLTVPGIASVKGVSRQHIQVSVDALCASRLVQLRENPAHRRSPLVTLSRKGRIAFNETRRRESAVLEQLAQGMSGRRLDTAAATLETLNSRLQPLIREEIDDD